MSRTILLPAALAVGLACALPAVAGDQMQGMAAAPAAPSPADQQLIDSALRAAPDKVGANASIVAIQADGSMRSLRAGDNGFTCMADNPETPGPDPMCMDAAAMEWVAAWIGHKDPPPGKVGFMYMLSGGTDASNTDPHAARPDASNHWVTTGPHVMIVGADADFYAPYPRGADPDTAVPYVMWAGTPYQHLMVPVR